MDVETPPTPPADPPVVFHLIPSTGMVLAPVLLLLVAGLPIGINTFCRLPTTVTGLCAVIFMGDDPGLIGEYDGVPERELPNETVQMKGVIERERERRCVN